MPAGGYSCRPGRVYSGNGNFVIDILLEIKIFRYRYGTADILVPGEHNIVCSTEEVGGSFGTGTGINSCTSTIP